MSKFKVHCPVCDNELQSSEIRVGSCPAHPRFLPHANVLCIQGTPHFVPSKRNTPVYNCVHKNLNIDLFVYRKRISTIRYCYDNNSYDTVIIYPVTKQINYFFWHKDLSTKVNSTFKHIPYTNLPLNDPDAILEIVKTIKLFS